MCVARILSFLVSKMKMKKVCLRTVRQSKDIIKGRSTTNLTAQTRRYGQLFKWQYFSLCNTSFGIAGSRGVCQHEPWLFVWLMSWSDCLPPAGRLDGLIDNH